MCRTCIADVRPDRGKVCLQAGSYLINFKGCVACHGRTEMKTIDMKTREEDNDDGEFEETVTYKHACGACGHIICEHFFSFSVQDGNQEWLMDCFLCGRGQDTVRPITLRGAATSAAATGSSALLYGPSSSLYTTPSSAPELKGRIFVDYDEDKAIGASEAAGAAAATATVSVTSVTISNASGSNTGTIVTSRDAVIATSFALGDVRAKLVGVNHDGMTARDHVVLPQVPHEAPSEFFVVTSTINSSTTTSSNTSSNISNSRMMAHSSDTTSATTHMDSASQNQIDDEWHTN